MYNKNSILYNIPEEQIATHSLEAKGKNVTFVFNSISFLI